MRLRSTGSRVPGTNDRIRENTNGPSQSCRSRGVETAEEPHGITRVHGLYQFLPPLYQRVFTRSQTTQRPDEERHALGVDPGETTSIRKTESASMQRTHTPHAKPPKPVRARSRRLQFRHRSNP